MAAVCIVLTAPGDGVGDPMPSVQSVRQQQVEDWELRIVPEGALGTSGAVRALAAEDPRISFAPDTPSAVAASAAPVVCFLEVGAAYPPDYVGQVLAAFQDPAVTTTVAARVVEPALGGPPFRLGPDIAPTAAQTAVVRSAADRPLPDMLSAAQRRDLPDVAVVFRAAEPASVTAIVEVTASSPPLSVKAQLVRLHAAGLPLIVVLAGAAGAAARLALRSWLRSSGVPVAPDRAAAVASAATEVVTFLPAGWEVEPAAIEGLAATLQGADAAAVIPVARDAGGSVLGAGLVWADARSLPQRFLQGHPFADIEDKLLAVPSPHPEGLTVRTAVLQRGGLDGRGFHWPLLTLARSGAAGPVLVDGRRSIAVPRLAPPAAAAGTPRSLGEAERGAVLAAAPQEAVASSRAAFGSLGWTVVGVQPDGPQAWSAVVARGGVRTEPVQQRRWALKIGAPAGDRGDPWGDVFFADDLGEALRELGNDVVIDRDGSAGRRTAYLDRVVLNIRGYQVVDRQPGAVNLLWVISHPDDIPAQELQQYDRVYAASSSWPSMVGQRLGVEVSPLLQATNPRRFHPDVADPDTGPDLLFVGNSRHQLRPIVADCRKAGLRPTIIGRDWEQFISAAEIAAQSIPNAELPTAYRSAGIVLNDHWGDMAGNGFLNNRLFDAVAAGARVVTDDVAGLRDVFGDSVAVYRTPADLARLCDPAGRAQFGSDDDRRAKAASIAEQHSFVARARRLMADAARFPVLPD